LEQVARRQDGVFSREQAQTCGLSRAEVRWRLEAGRLERIWPGVFRIVGVPPSWRQHARATLLAAARGGGEVALSHASAAYVYGLDGFSGKAPYPLDLMVERGHQTPLLRGVSVHRASATLPTNSFRGLRVTTLAKTMVDLASRLTGAPLELALDSAQRLSPTLGRALHTLLVRGQPGVAHLRELLDSRLAHTDSPLEARVFRRLRTEGLAVPSNQFEVSDEDGFVARVDFAWPTRRVALHVDGYRWHYQRERFERDRCQLARLTALGWVSVHVTAASLDQAAWVNALSVALAARNPQLGFINW
jgi:G:T-mismatch repair DNA endonuclease (very short patch repair protein)